MSVEEEGTDDAIRLLRELRDRARNLTPAWPAVGDYIADEVGQQFATEGARFGRPWDPLNPRYRRWKVAKGFIDKTLQATGAMMRSFTSRPMDVEEYHPTHAFFGSAERKAGWHHFGTDTIPARPILMVTDRMADDVNTKLAAYITEGRVR